MRSAVPVTFSSSRSSGQGNADPRWRRDTPSHRLFAWTLRQQNQLQFPRQGDGSEDRQEEVLTVDARNHGDSPHSPDASYEAMSRDLQGLFPQLGLAPCVVVGHSMGGKTAMLLALQRKLIWKPREFVWDLHWSDSVSQPDLVERLVVVDISPVGTTPGSHLGNFIAAMKAVEIPEKVPHSQARKLADRQLTSAVKFLLTNLVEPISTDSTMVARPSHHSEIRRLFPQAQFQTVPDAGHWVHSDKPQDFMDAVTGFLT
ncbi:Protein ABHD11 [Apodemus speciosus]|uniref:sn-1-specific diacylglycerol lipase ABHD11 n=1 Tax=Apodemus speciosus TaxID=105296 RepID=A0ABQ0ET80_APOSI